ncbi:FAD-dependent oxidoreductase [Phormidesmis priestleyi]
MQQKPILKNLVLVGGGHSHAIALGLFGMNPLPDVRLTLISEAPDTSYSGMLPGHIAGFYTHEDCHIDLRSLARFAQADFWVDRAVGLDLENHQVLCENQAPVTFDWVSIDVGSTPKLPSILGAAEHSIPAKPVQKLLDWWDQFCHQLCHQRPAQSRTISIVGGGTGGIELALNMQHRLLEIESDVTLHLFQRDSQLMPKHGLWVRHFFEKLLTQRGIHLHLSETVREVQQGAVVCRSGLTIACDATVWVTEASAPDWLGKAGLDVDQDGFILVNDALQSVSHPQVFAAGDIATMVNYSRPKAGVFAVRQGKPLFNNLRRIIQQQPLQPYHPQKRYLSLIGTGDRSAVASYGKFGWRSPLLWFLKDRIDQSFMNQFRPLE